MIKPLENNKYKFKQVVARFYWKDFKKIIKTFPALRGESAASYFQRLAHHLQNVNGKNRDR